jgi:hypothetical protein
MFWRTNIPLLDWPARSLDLNPIENLWGILAREVYINGRQYSTSTELKVENVNAWRQIWRQTLGDLVNSMPSRMFAVINENEGPTKY